LTVWAATWVGSVLAPAPAAASPARLVSGGRPAAGTDGWQAVAVTVPLVVVLFGLALTGHRRAR
jgi:hypothetical protein